MNRRIKIVSGVWQHLQQSGVLDHGTAEDIEAARKAYWNAYKRQWKRQAHKVYTVSLTCEESTELIRAAKAHHTTPTAFIRHAALAYIRKAFVVPDSAAMQEIRMLLAKNYILLQEIADGSPTISCSPSLLHNMADLELRVSEQLTHPSDIETYLQQAIAANPGYLEKLLEVIQSCAP